MYIPQLSNGEYDETFSGKSYYLYMHKPQTPQVQIFPNVSVERS